MTTPEGLVKAELRRILKEYTGIFTYWPVPMGFGSTTLDVLGCYRGRFFSVETKAPKKKPTLRQAGRLNEIEEAMGRTFVIAGINSPVFGELRIWLDQLTNTVPYEPYLTPDAVKRRPI